MKGVQCYELFGGIALKKSRFSVFFSTMHHRSCRVGIGCFLRHTAINIFWDLSKQLTSVLIPFSFHRGDSKHPDGMTTFLLRCGKWLVCGTTCLNTLAIFYFRSSAV